MKCILKGDVPIVHIETKDEVCHPRVTGLLIKNSNNGFDPNQNDKNPRRASFGDFLIASKIKLLSEQLF